MVDTITLVVQLGSKSEMLTFYMAKRLETSVILGCDFCEKYAEDIRQRKSLVELYICTTEPIIRKKTKGFLKN